MTIFWTNQPIDNWGSDNTIIFTIKRIPVRTLLQVVHSLIAVLFSNIYFNYPRLNSKNWQVESWYTLVMVKNKNFANFEYPSLPKIECLVAWVVLGVPRLLQGLCLSILCLFTVVVRICLRKSTLLDIFGNYSCHTRSKTAWLRVLISPKSIEQSNQIRC